MSKYQTLQEILRNVNNGVYNPAVPYPTRDMYPSYPEGYVFDPDKSVNWNREQREKNAEARLNALKRYTNARQAGENQFREDIIEYLIAEYGLNKKQADMILTRAWDESHSEGFREVANTANDLAGFVSDIMEIQTETDGE